MIDRPGEFAAQIGVVERLEAIGQNAGLGQSRDPQFPVFAAHHLDGGGSFFFAGGLDRNFGDFAGAGIERL
ncbi:hypothetical protein D3C87_2118920 [compost metagenome]